jgi:4-hydroxy-tetrahydrodipicolinate reductase
MKIALIGYGKMGKEIEAAAAPRGHSVSHRISSRNISELSAMKPGDTDVAIEFSTPHTVIPNLVRCLNGGIPVVVGTTGWYESFGEIEKLCREKNGALLHATNFSLGVNLFFKVNRQLAELMNRHEAYDVSMEEIHHIHKLDRPSGTAITLASQIIDRIERKKKWSIVESGDEIITIKDTREGEVPGTHIIRYTSEIDDIEIVHRAHNRKGFALGAVIAAEFLHGKKGVYSMGDVI